MYLIFKIVFDYFYKYVYALACNNNNDDNNNECI